MADLTTIGQAAGHVEGSAKVTGGAKYTADIILPGLLWGRCLRSPFPHARIVSIDASAARKLPGVHAVITADDVPDVLHGRFILDVPTLARGKVRFLGEKVAAVAAETEEIAEQAVSLIDVEYEELPAVLDVDDAMQEHSPRIHDDPTAYSHMPIPDFMHGENTIGPPIPNTISHTIVDEGDIDAGFALADDISEHTFYVPAIHQGYIEPYACVVQIDSEDRVNVWLSNKAPFFTRSQLAAAIGATEDQVRVNPIFIGGDFGGKGALMDAIVCYYLAERSGRPVKMVMNYTDELMAGNPRHTCFMTFRTGVTEDGRITARHASMIFDTGAYGGFTPMPMLHGGFHAGGSYKIPNLKIEMTRVYTNTVPRGHMRSPGAPQVIFAVESHMDMLANKLGMDPLEFRMRNALQEGDEGPMHEHWHDIRCKETLQAAADAIGWDEEKPRNVGRGIALYDRPAGEFGPSSAVVSIGEDGAVNITTGGAETGTGFYTILQQIAAQELSVPLEGVTISQGDTDSAPFEVGPGGSRLTYTAGQALLAATTEIKNQLAALAAEMAGVPPEDVQAQDGAFNLRGRSVKRPDLLAWAKQQGKLPLVATGRFMPTQPSGVNSFHAQAAEVEVDTETGQVRIRKFVTAHDVGTVINPLTHQGQVEGGVIFGVGQALIEHLQMEDGSVTTLNLGDYKLPNIADIPQLDTVLLEAKPGPAPYQGKAIGEMSNVAVPAAIANAVHDAVGVRFTDLPITSEKVHEALRARESSK